MLSQRHANLGSPGGTLRYGLVFVNLFHQAFKVSIHLGAVLNLVLVLALLERLHVCLHKLSNTVLISLLKVLLLELGSHLLIQVCLRLGLLLFLFHLLALFFESLLSLDLACLLLGPCHVVFESRLVSAGSESTATCGMHLLLDQLDTTLLNRHHLLGDVTLLLKQLVQHVIAHRS